MIAAKIAEQTDEYLWPFIEAGINPDDYVLEQGPLRSSTLFGVITFTMDVRLRPKTDEERALESGDEGGHA